MTSSSKRGSKIGKQASRTCLIFVSEGATALFHDQTGDTTVFEKEIPLVDQEKTPLDPLVALYGQLCGAAIYIQPRQQPDGSFLYDYQDVGAQMQGQIGFNKTGLSRDDAIQWGQHCVKTIKLGQTGDETHGETKDGQGGQYPWHGVGDT